MYKFSNVNSVHIKPNFLNENLLTSALEWIINNSNLPNHSLQPNYDINDDKQIYAKKIRKIYWHDPEYWNKWLNDSNLLKLVKEYIDTPILIKHAAFIKRHKNESYIPLHQDLALWEKPYKTAITFWIALTDSTTTNGGMFYYPVIDQIFEHVLDIKYPQFKSIDLDKEKINEKTLINLNVSKGDIVIWPGSLPHGSNYNTNNTLRIGMPFVFVDKSEFNEGVCYAK